MPPDHTRKATEIDPGSLSVNFAPEVRQAFSDLAAAVHFSERFDGDILGIVEEWSATSRPSMHDAVTAMPLIAEETFKHVHATGDRCAEKAWHEIGSELLGRGFTVQKTPMRRR